MRRSTAYGSEKIIHGLQLQESCPLKKCTFSSREGMIRTCEKKSIISCFCLKPKIRYVCSVCKVWKDDTFIPENVTIKDMSYDHKN